jgi:hypothetical protein
MYTQIVFLYELQSGIMTRESYENDGRERYLHEDGQRVLEKAIVLQQDLVKTSSRIGKEIINDSRTSAIRVQSELSTSVQHLARSVSRMITEQSEPYLPNFVRMDDVRNNDNGPDIEEARRQGQPNKNKNKEVKQGDDVGCYHGLENRVASCARSDRGSSTDSEISSDSENYDDYRRS